ncbi:MAG TPA: hypothetical protein VFM01_12305 [Nakamurella sp.]|jgi:hypothetical protein|nr:hypothetical protein [Nakamurella sp.]
MKEFMLLYRLPADHVNDEADEAAWNAWLTGLGDALLDVGRPITDSATIGGAGPALRLAGFSTIAAADLRDAQRMAVGCPAMTGGGTVEVGALVPMPEGHGPQ